MQPLRRRNGLGARWRNSLSEGNRAERARVAQDRSGSILGRYHVDVARVLQDLRVRLGRTLRRVRPHRVLRVARKKSKSAWLVASSRNPPSTSRCLEGMSEGMRQLDLGRGSGCRVLGQASTLAQPEMAQIRDTHEACLLKRAGHACTAANGCGRHARWKIAARVRCVANGCFVAMPRRWRKLGHRREVGRRS